MADPLYEPVLEIQTILLARTTGMAADYERYVALRNALVSEERIRGRLPAWLRACRDLNAFWSYIQPKFPSYAERLKFIRDEFQALLDDLEHDMPAGDREVTAILERLTTDTVREVWERAQARRSDDPHAAITIARTLLETVCKHILDDEGVACDEGDELPRLYRLTAETLEIAPNDATEDAFRESSALARQSLRAWARYATGWVMPTGAVPARCVSSRVTRVLPSTLPARWRRFLSRRGMWRTREICNDLQTLMRCDHMSALQNSIFRTPGSRETTGG
jgi:hypothetical protein